MNHSQHGACRLQQRGIPTEALEVLMTFGEARVRHGAEVIFMTRRTREEARLALGAQRYARLVDRLGIYAVQASDGQVLTCAKRLRRLKF